MKHSKFTDIGQFRSVVYNIKHAARYAGLDKDGEHILDLNIDPPVVTFEGTIKLHGTNSGVAMNSDGEVWFQSRTNIVTPEKDNAGFAFFANSNIETFKSFINEIKTKNHLTDETVIIFGEWCGKGIQKGVAINELPKMFVIFDVKIIPTDDDVANYYLPKDKWNHLSDVDNKIYNIQDFPSFTIDIDFNRPDLAQNKLAEITEQVEKECPVGKAFDKSGIGEGVVWTGEYKGTRYTFKVKGEKHSTSKVKTLAPVDTEKLNSINEFVDYAVTENRLNQAIEQVFSTNSLIPSMQGTGDFLRWVVNDIIKEESDTLVDNKLEPKDVNKYVSIKARQWFFTKLNKMVGI